MVTVRNQLPAGPARGRFDAVVLFNEPLCREHFRLRLRVADSFEKPIPGQFVQLGCRPPNGALDPGRLLGHSLVLGDEGWPDPTQPELCGQMALLRRPFSVAGFGLDSAGDGGRWIDVIHRVVGVGTQWLADLQRGDAVDLMGPLGNWFQLPAERQRALLVGGGVGLPPMFYLAEALHDAGWDTVAFVGATTKDLLPITPARGVEPHREGVPTPCIAQFARVAVPSVVTTDDGSCGLKGVITDGLERVLGGLSSDERHGTVVFTCGPVGMLKAAAKLAAEHGIDCQVCLEQAMACGMGTCQSCVVRIEATEAPHGRTPDGRPWRYRLACTDGPVFEAGSVVW